MEGKDGEFHLVWAYSLWQRQRWDPFLNIDTVKRAKGRGNLQQNIHILKKIHKILILIK